MQPQGNFTPVANKGLVTLSVMLATIMQVLDTTIANVALPHMQGSLSATQDQITWVLTSYIVASAIMTPPTGWLAGKFGRKKIFCMSVVGFTVASGLCGISTSIEEMVFFRMVQGIFGASMVPLSQAVMLDINPKENHGSAMALWGMGVMVGPILGPTLGGYLTEYYNWRWVFYINVPLGILAFMGIFAYLPESERHNRPFDKFGFLTLSLAIASLQLMLDRGEQKDWFSSIEIVFYLAVMCSCLWMFIKHINYVQHPFVNLALFKDRNYVTSLIFIFFVGIILLATMALLPPYMQNLMGYSVIDIGILLAPRGIGTLVAMMIVGKVARRSDPRLLIFIGMSLTVISLWDMSHFSSFVPETMIIRSGVVQGFGLGFIFVPLSTIAYATLAPYLRTEAAGLYSLMRNMGSSLGVSAVVVMLSHNIQINHSYLGENITQYNTGLAMQYMPQAYVGNNTMALAAVDLQVIRQAATIAYINDFKLLMIVVLSAMPFILLLRKPVRKPDVTEQSAGAALE